MNIQISEVGSAIGVSDGSPIARVEGRLDAHECPVFRDSFDSLLEDGNNSVRLDLREVDFVDSAGLAEIVRAMKRCRERGGDLTLVGLSSAVQVIFELTGLGNVFAVESI